MKDYRQLDESWTLSDREAVKRLLVHAFGPVGKPEAGRGGGNAAYCVSAVALMQ